MAVNFAAHRTVKWHMSLRLSRYRHPFITAALLAVGVGAAASMITVLRALSPSGLPYPGADRLVVARVGGPSWSPAMLEALASASTVFEDIAGVQERAATLTAAAATDPGQAQVVRLESVSASYFAMLGAQPAMGRVFDAREDQRNSATAVAVISDVLWRRRFNGAHIIGRQIAVDGRRLDVIGVMPPRFGGLIGRTDIWTPLGSARWLAGDTGPERSSSRWFEVIARYRAGVSFDTAQARFGHETRAAILQIPGGDQIAGAKTMLTLVPLSAARVPSMLPRATRVLAIAVATLLVLVIANLTSLHLLRTDARGPELAIRISLGAGRGQIASMAMREAGIIATAGAIGALALRPLFLLALEAIQPRSTSFGIVTAEVLTANAHATDATTIGVVALLAISGALPLALAMIGSAQRLNVERTLRGASSVMFGVRRTALRPTRTILVAVQATLACVVIGGGALLTQSASQLLARDRGYDVDGVMTARVLLPNSYDQIRTANFYRELVATLAAKPGITTASVSNCAPGGGRCRRSTIASIDGRALEPSTQPTVGVHYMTPSHFATIGAHLERGRTMDDSDRRDGLPVAVISAPLAAALWPGANPIGRTLEIFTANGSLNGARTVIGIVKPIAFDLESDPGLDVFLPAAQAAWTSGVVFVRSSEPRAAQMRAIAEAAASIDGAVPVFEAGGLDLPLARSLSIESFLRRTLIAFGVMGLVLAAIGTYGVTAQAVAESRRELAIRSALGATPHQIRSLIARRGLVIAVAAAAAGVIGVLWSGALLQSLLHGFPANDPIALATGPIITMAAVLIAVMVPAVRAAAANPLRAMQS